MGSVWMLTPPRSKPMSSTGSWGAGPKLSAVPLPETRTLPGVQTRARRRGGPSGVATSNRSGRGNDGKRTAANAATQLSDIARVSAPEMQRHMSGPTCMSETAARMVQAAVPELRSPLLRNSAQAAEATVGRQRVTSHRPASVEAERVATASAASLSREATTPPAAVTMTSRSTTAETPKLSAERGNPASKGA